MQCWKHAHKINDFNGKLGEFLFVYPEDDAGNVQMFVGLGSRAELNARRFQDAGGLLAKRLAKLNMESIILDLSETGDIDPSITIKPFVEGIAIGAYTFSKYFAQKEPFPLGRMTVVIPGGVDDAQARHSVEIAAFNVQASNVARLLTDEASNHKTPAKFERLIREQFRESGFTIRVLDNGKLESEQLNLIRAVGQAGSDTPRMLILERIVRSGEFTLGMIGKAVTFDSGGLMIKSHESMPYMREDVAGAAALVGTLSVVKHVNPDYNIVAAIPIAENLIDSKAYRPSDVIITRSGLSVETNNTDAEGRLLLADAMMYLQDTYKLNMLVDVATLTGAICRALGAKMAGYFTNSEELAGLFSDVYQMSREKFWRMPLEHSYQGLLKSQFADIRNDPGEPKAITAALFLESFIKSDLPWLHLDVGSIILPHDPTTRCYGGTSATGVPALTLIEFLREIGTHRSRFKQ